MRQGDRTPGRTDTENRMLHSTRIALLSGLVLASAVSLGGCSLFDRGFEPTAMYLLDPPQQSPIEGASIGSVLVTRFSAVAPFDGRAFVSRNTDGTWRTDAYAGFMAKPSEMISQSLSRAVERSGRASTVGVESVAMRFDFSLEGVIESFYADFSDAASPTAVVELRGYLLDRRDGAPRLVAQFKGSGRAPIASAETGAVADALSAAAGAAIHDLLSRFPKNVPAAGASAAAADPSSGG
jgi:ABC-type uncharacterized transport system auxiliary subunit